MQIIKNALPQDYFEEIVEIVNNPNFNFFLSFDSNDEYSETVIHDLKHIKTPQLIHTLINDNKDNSNYINFFEKSFLLLKEKYNLKGNILKSKINLLLNNSKCQTKDIYNTPHVDCDLNHTSTILFLNKSDGHTFIFNESFPNYSKTLTIKEMVEPEPNKLIIINNNFHASSNPINYSTRLVLNTVFI